MGDIDVDFFLETLKNLETSHNLDFAKCERHQLQSLPKEIEYLREFLKKTEKKRNKHPEVMDLVKRIRDVVFETEEIVERFVVRVSKANHSLLELQDHLFLDLASVVERRIKDLRAEVEDILDKDVYDIKAIKRLKSIGSGSGGGSSNSLGARNTDKVGEEMVVIGFEDEASKVMRKLGDLGQLEIISIIGIGGGGKTTLARKVYDSPLMLQTFDIRAWLNVSQDYNNTMKRDLLISILESANPKKEKKEYEKICENKLAEDVFICLRGKKYLIVMDDIWNLEAWIDMERSFPNNCYSRVLLTSRVPVQPKDISFTPHYLDPLSDSFSWELLRKKVFNEKQCPPGLEDIGKQIAKKCGGLPLAIVAIAGILATEDKTRDVWEKVGTHLGSTINAKDQERCMEILELSYNHLPLHLKACFLYIGAHPEDYEIPTRELIWLWIGEGFIQQGVSGKSLEAVAEDHLIDLIKRNLVMEARKRSTGTTKACRIHDLLRELCLKKGKEDNFFVQSYRDDSSSPSVTNNHRRLFIGTQLINRFSSLCGRNVHSILCPALLDKDEYSEEVNFSFFVENFELLRVLYFNSVASIGELRKGDLVHLRYLALALPAEEHHHRAPNIFHYLLNLKILNVEVAWDRISLSHDIFKMVKLRHLYTRRGIFTYHHASHVEDEGNTLDNLQSLCKIGLCEDCLRFLKRTPYLTKLGLSGQCTDQWDGDLTLPDLEFLECLQKLSLSGWDKREGVTTTNLKLPSSLTQLTLMQTHLEWEHLSSILLNLTSLKVLKLLTDACKGQVWDTSELEENFSELRYLRLHSLDIKQWIASNEQFPKLEVLVIKSCDNLEEIPCEFAEIPELCEIKVEDSSLSAEESARKIQEDQKSIKGDDACLKLIARYNADRSAYW